MGVRTYSHKSVWNTTPLQQKVWSLSTEENRHETEQSHCMYGAVYIGHDVYPTIILHLKSFLTVRIGIVLSTEQLNGNAVRLYQQSANYLNNGILCQNYCKRRNTLE